MEVRGGGGYEKGSLGAWALLLGALLATGLVYAKPSYRLTALRYYVTSAPSQPSSTPSPRQPSLPTPLPANPPPPPTAAVPIASLVILTLLRPAQGPPRFVLMTPVVSQLVSAYVCDCRIRRSTAHSVWQFAHFLSLL